MARLDFDRFDTLVGFGAAVESDQVGFTVTRINDFPEDGWITNIGFWAAAEPDAAGSIDIKPVLYIDYDRKWVGSVVALGKTMQERGFSVGNKKVYRDERVEYGYVRYDPFGDNEEIYMHLMELGNSQNYGYPATLYSVGRHTQSPPTRSDDWGWPGFNYDAAYRGGVTYTKNEKPGQGAWQSPTPANNATGVSLNPTIGGSLSHPNGDGAIDETTSIFLVVHNETDGGYAYQGSFSPTSSEKADNAWSRSNLLPTLKPGTTYRMYYQHKDTFDEWGSYSAERTFTTILQPNVPVPIAPSGKIAGTTGIQYQATYSHSSGTQADQAQVEVYDANGNSLIYTTTLDITNVASGGTVTVPQWHAALVAGTYYQWRMRILDTAGAWSPWTSKQVFHPNAPPRPPENLTPNGGKRTDQRVFSCSVSDPDGDPITGVQIELVNDDTEVVVAGFPKQMTLSADGLSATYAASSAEMPTFEVNYKWRARATDGGTPGYGSYSAYSLFLYAETPVQVDLVTPTSTRRTNIIEWPDAEDDGTGYWTELGRTAVNFIDRIRAGGEDESFWRGVEEDGSTNVFQGDMHSIDPTKPYYCTVKMARDAESLSLTSMYLECLNNSDAVIGVVYPFGLRPIQAVSLTLGWRRYGGIVWPIGSSNTPAFPAGTTKVRVNTLPSASKSTVKFNQFQLEQVPLLSAADWDAVRTWYGFADGSTTPFGVGGYEWAGVEAGSASSVLYRLTNPTTYIVINYISKRGTPSPKEADRTIIETWDATLELWVQHHDSGWISSARTLVPIPLGVLEDKVRYRVRIEARDLIGDFSSSDWSEFDTDFEPAPELAITNYNSDPERGIISFDLEPSTIPSAEFVKTQLAISSEDEELVIIAEFDDPNATEFTYHYPASDIVYTFWTRQSQDQGNRIVYSDWYQVNASVSYPETFFVKDIWDPANLWVAFKILHDDIPDDSREADINRYSLVNQIYPTHGQEQPRERGINVTMLLSNGVNMIQSTQDRWNLLQEFDRRRPTICYMSSWPSERFFGVFDGRMQFTAQNNGIMLVDTTIRRTLFDDNAYKKTGVYDLIF